MLAPLRAQPSRGGVAYAIASRSHEPLMTDTAVLQNSRRCCPCRRSTRRRRAVLERGRPLTTRQPLVQANRTIADLKNQLMSLKRMVPSPGKADWTEPSVAFGSRISQSKSLVAEPDGESGGSNVSPALQRQPSKGMPLMRQESKGMPIMRPSLRMRATYRARAKGCRAKGCLLRGSAPIIFGSRGQPQASRHELDADKPRQRRPPSRAPIRTQRRRRDLSPEGSPPLGRSGGLESGDGGERGE